MGEYVNVTDVFRTLDLVMSDDNIKHKGKAIRKRLKELPTEDVEKVVSCKDCQYGRGNDYDGNIKVPFMYFCTYDDISYNGADHFCSYGIRKVGAEGC